MQKVISFVKLSVLWNLLYKNTHNHAYVSVEKIYKALQYLKDNGHPEYQFYDDFNVYKKRCQKLKIEHIDDNQVEEN